MPKSRFLMFVRLALVLAAFCWLAGQTDRAKAQNGPGNGPGQTGQMRSTTQAQRQAAASRLANAQRRVSAAFAGLNPATAAQSPLGKAETTPSNRRLGAASAMALPGNGVSTPLATMGTPRGTPDYFAIPNWANSPLPWLDAAGAVVPGTGIRKFVNTLPGLCGISTWGTAGTNELGQCIPLATPFATPPVGVPADGDYYEIGLKQYSRKLHTDLPATTLRGYADLNPSAAAPGVNQYLGPLIVAKRNRPVRVKFTNSLGTGALGNLFIPTDTTYMGAGNGPLGTPYSQNRATLHLHGGVTPWISDGTPHQWTVPAGEVTDYKKGLSARDVPDMPATGDGTQTYYWTNQQSGRLMFYHDHAYGITRLNVYAGEAAGYLLVDPAQENALATATVPGTIGTTPDLTHVVPLVIQDKSFVPDSGVAGGQLAAQDPTWDVAGWGGAGSLWFPHVYMPNQNPYDDSGSTAFGRWDYGPWFWPPQNPGSLLSPPVSCSSLAYPGQALTCPGTPNPSGTPEAFMDTPVVNGTLYPKLPLQPAAYRFQILNASNDRGLNLQLYVADPLSVALTSSGSGYTSVPTVGFTGGGGAGAAATAIVSTGAVTAINVTAPGSGYTSPSVVISGGGGTGATATAALTSGVVTGIVVTNGGTGYTTVPSLTITDVTGSGATATAVIAPAGLIIDVLVTAPGSGYTTAPTVSFTGGGGTGAAAVASINSEVKMVDAVPHTSASTPPLCTTVTQAGAAGLAVANLDGSGKPIYGTGLPANCWPTTWPADGRDGGVPDPAAAGPPIMQIGTEGGLLPALTVIPSTPVGYEYNRRSITVLNILNHALLLGPAERADVVIDFSAFAGKTLLLYNDAPAPVPAFDSRSDYYTGDPDQTLTGGAPSTLPGYGPNTRTVMQIQVAAAAPSTTFNPGTLRTALPGIFSATQDPIIVPEVAYGAAQNTYVRIQDTSLSLFPVGSALTGLDLTNGGSGFTSVPAVTITGGGGVGATATASLTPRGVGNLTLTSSGSGYTSAPAVTITGGGGSGATATAALASTTVASISVTNSGSGYNSTGPTVAITGGGGTGAAAVAVMTRRIGFLTYTVSSIRLTNPGSGYTSVPTVTLTGGGGSGARGRANLARSAVASLTLGSAGSGYTSAPTVGFSGGGGSGAAATAAVTASAVASLTLTNSGSGYTSTPLVAITGGGGTGATGAAVIALDPLTGIALIGGGSGYTSVPAVGISGGGGAGAAATAILAPTSLASLTLTAAGSGYTSAPVLTFTGGGGTGAQAAAVLGGASIGSISVTNSGTGYNSTGPTVSITGGGGTGATARAVMTRRLGFVTYLVSSIQLTSPGSGYTSVPTVTLTGGGGSGAAGRANLGTAAVVSLTLVDPGTGFTSAPTISFSGGGGSGAAATAQLAPSAVSGITLTSPGSGYASAPTVAITGGGGSGATAIALTSGSTIPLQPKAIQELFTLDYGRMNATLGVELPFTNFLTQTTIPYNYVDPPTEIFKDGDTQVWKITHNGVDTHFMHFHLFGVQVLNRVGWDGAVKPPDPNELSWKDTVRMNPLEDIIVALKPLKPALPWDLPNSIRPLDVTRDVTYTSAMSFTNVDPTNQPATVTNDLTNFGWEYVWHCHLLGHEENDMMRAMVLAVPPRVPSSLAGAAAGALGSQHVVLTWTDHSLNETGFTVQRATSVGGPWTTLGEALPGVGAGTTVSFTDPSAPPATYFYRVIANNLVGYTRSYVAPAGGYPSLSADSAPVAASSSVTTH